MDKDTKTLLASLAVLTIKQSRTDALRKAIKRGGKKLASAVEVLSDAFDGDVDAICAFIKLCAKMAEIKRRCRLQS